MSIVNKLTFRHLKGNMKRTIVTLCGIIISVAMVTAVFTSAISFMDFLKTVAITYEGEWHQTYSDCTLDNIETLKDQNDIGKVGSIISIGNVDINLNSKSKKESSELTAVNSDYIAIRNIEITSGEMPKNSKEILVTKSFIESNNLEWKVGDKVQLNVLNYANNNEKYTSTPYVISGITSSTNSATDFNAFFCGLDSTTPATGITAYVQNDKLNNSIWDKTKSDAKSIGRNAPDSVNTELFVYSGVTKDNYMISVLGVFSAIILTIIVFASVFMIYDSFAVSFQQRSRYLGMLASVGATKKQKRSSVYFEGFLLGIIGIPLGIIAGIVGIAITFKCISSTLLSTFAIPVDRALSVRVNWLVILGSVLISALTIFISAYIPARKASKVTPIEAIRQTNTVKVKNSKKLKTSKLSTKLFGYEGALAAKNFKRNGKRSRNIVFALSMSVVLFLSVTNFSTIFTNIMDNSYGGADADIYSFVDKNGVGKMEDVLNNTKCVESFDGYGCRNITVNNLSSLMNEDGKKYLENFTSNSLTVCTVDKASFENYCKELNINPKELNSDKNQPINAILVNNIEVKNVGKTRTLTLSPLSDVTGKVFDGTFLENVTDEGEKAIGKTQIKVIHQTNVKPKSVNLYSSEEGTSPFLFVEESNFFNIFKKSSESVKMSYAIKAKDHEKVYNEIDDKMSQYENISFSSYDQTSQMQSMTAINTIAAVFGYGFITLITLISIMNIINTISTSMEERRREFAMIKSVGLTPKSFKKMIYMESINYGLKSLLWGLPISFAVDYLLYYVSSKSFNFGYTFHWQYYLIAVVAVFLVILFALLYSITKIKNDNIIETLKSDDI